MRDGVIITRPPPGLAPTMAAVAALGWRPIAAPMLEVIPLGLASVGRQPDAVVLTSGQAIAALDDPRLHACPCYVVGQATARRARAAGFVHVITASGTAADLVDMLREACPAGSRLLLAVGRGYGRDMADELRGAGLRVTRRCVYAVEAVRGLPDAAVTALLAEQVRGVMFYSTRTAEAFMAALTPVVADTLARVDAIAMSAGIAAALADGPRWRAMRVAARPEQDAMLASLGRPASG
ncbi:uroporphyrinogen-III synthase [Komagataeibacter sp. FNDCF1]|uniref:uroporphyrinogen-III synthase n=1 Tax=Komagataeibacter sp. FNDCF1 TaxID=2878681 RepID=UPI001E4E5598|nr:uroporphyrinogen-III synthase [Komagataeibacter sp. FNDCF1]MCE2565993.1 uroporphyrinogen-III synthase [Komagataeibacter sp. FNDCF1]